MITAKSLLSVKEIAYIDDLNNNELGILGTDLFIKNNDGIVKTIGTIKDNGDMTFNIYGIRVPVKNDLNSMTDYYIQKVLIKRTINKETGEYSDEELVGDDSGLDYFSSYSELPPFNDMISETKHVVTAIQDYKYLIQGETTEYSKDPENNEELEFEHTRYFTKLPLFFKNKTKTRTINNKEYDYYLISDIYWDDFYPVESHLRPNGTYAECIWIESDWHPSALESPQSTSKFFKSDFIKEAESKNEPTYCINGLVWYNYLYYIYMLKTSSFRPFLGDNPNCPDEFNDKSCVFAFLDTNTSKFVTLDGNDFLESNETFTINASFQYENYSNKTKLYLTLNVNNTPSPELAGELKQQLNGFKNFGIVINHVSSITHEDEAQCIACYYYGSDYTKVIFDCKNIKFETASDFHSSDYYNRTFDVLVIKRIPDDLDVIAYPDRPTWIDYDCFKTDNLYNLFPIFFVPFTIPFRIDDLLLQKAFSLNYNSFIDTGVRDSYINEYNYRNVIRAETLANIPEVNIKFFNGVIKDFVTTDFDGETTSNALINTVANFDNKKIKTTKIISQALTKQQSDLENFIARGKLDGKCASNNRATVEGIVPTFTHSIGIKCNSYYTTVGGNHIVFDTPEFGWNNFSIVKNIYNNIMDLSKSDKSFVITRLMYFE